MDELLCLDTEDTASKTSPPHRRSSVTSVPGQVCPYTTRRTACSRFPGRVHYKERLVELINRSGCDPVVLFSPAEMRAELQRWNLAVPPRRPEEPEPLYLHRLRLVSDFYFLPS